MRTSQVIAKIHGNISRLVSGPVSKQFLPVHPADAQHTLPTKAPALFAPLPSRKPERPEATCDEENVLPKLHLPQLHPGLPHVHPCGALQRNQEQQGHPKAREQRWPQLLRGRFGVSPRLSAPTAGTKSTTAPPNLSKDEARAPSHQSMAQAEFILWHFPGSPQGDTISSWQCRTTPR